eukprot:TRINITY_DN4049_c0_g1_i1.p1 TRINITY_DN4049_c0_g1~~TRINITY_DN4049_c0_g1_i1.p1  ORF type:complete len:144 (-),score=27.41 TRINITY_DN4049_c0_g1_i1:190-579(-)
MEQEPLISTHHEEQEISLKTTEATEDEAINRTVLVTSISLSATSKAVTDFFAFCGTIKSLTLRTIPGADSQEAIIEFKQEAATKTALLLTNALIVDKPITVSKYQKETPKAERKWFKTNTMLLLYKPPF